jgi:hypothetical protein
MPIPAPIQIQTGDVLSGNSFGNHGVGDNQMDSIMSAMAAKDIAQAEAAAANERKRTQLLVIGGGTTLIALLAILIFYYTQKSPKA